MKIRDKNPLLRGMIANLEKKSRENKAPIWQSLAERLNKPRRRSAAVNLHDIEKHTQAKDIVLVPGKLLSEGDITKPITIAAYTISPRAKEKVEKAGGSTLSIEQLIEKNPTGKGIRIIG